MSAAAELNRLRAERAHLEAQLEAEVDTRYATVDQAARELGFVLPRIAELEAEVIRDPETSYLVARGRGRKKVKKQGPTREVIEMARKTNASVLAETLVKLRRAEKRAGNTKWALHGAGARKNPPSKEKKADLIARYAAELDKVAELRATRDELQAKVKS